MRHGHVIWGTPTLLNAFAEECAFPLNSSLSLKYPSLEVGFDDDGFRFYGSYGNRTEQQHFHLPQNWDEAVTAVKKQHAEFICPPVLDTKAPIKPFEAVDTSTLKPGDFVFVLPEDSCFDNCEHDDSGNAMIQIVSKENPSNLGWVSLLFSDGSTNTYKKVRRATPEEIEKCCVIPASAGGYKLEDDINKNGQKTIGYGCRQFTSEQIDALIEAISISGDIGKIAKFTLKNGKLTIGDIAFDTKILATLKSKIK